jgi:hypothetical protein
MRRVSLRLVRSLRRNVQEEIVPGNRIAERTVSGPLPHMVLSEVPGTKLAATVISGTRDLIRSQTLRLTAGCFGSCSLILRGIRTA